MAVCCLGSLFFFFTAIYLGEVGSNQSIRVEVDIKNLKLNFIA